MRKPDTFMPWFVGDYLKDTQHLTRDQHGGYMLLLGAYWVTGAALPDDDSRLAQIAKATPTEWRKLRPILSEFFTVGEGRWHSKRQEKELARAVRYVEAKSKAGAKGAAQRWQSHAAANGTAMPNQSQTDAPPPPSPQIPNATHSAGPVEIWEQVWSEGRAYLVANGQSEGDARKALMRWRQNHDELAILRALKIAKQNAVELPIPYIESVLKQKAKTNGTTGQSGAFSRLHAEAKAARAEQAGRADIFEA